MTFLMLMAQFCAGERAGRMEEQGETSTVEHLFTTDELTIEIRKARPKVRSTSDAGSDFCQGLKVPVHALFHP